MNGKDHILIQNLFFYVLRKRKGNASTPLWPEDGRVDTTAYKDLGALILLSI